MVSLLWSWCFLIMLPTAITTKSKKDCPRGDEPFFSNSHCAYHSEPQNWSTAVRICAALGAKETLLDVLVKEDRKLMTAYLRDEKKLTALWTEVNQPVVNRPRRFQLPNYGRIFDVNRNGDVLESAGIQWSIEPPRGSCVLLTLGLSDRELALRMENCSLEYPIMCFTSIVPRDRMDEVMSKREKILKKALAETPDPELTPKLQIRHDEAKNEIFLDVYRYERMWNFPKQHPICYVEGAPLAKSDEVLVEFLSHDDRNKVSKYRIITEQDGYMTCHAWISDSLHFIRTERFLHRATHDGQTYVVAIKYKASICRDVLCDPSIDPEFLRNPTARIEEVMHALVYSVDAVKVNFRSEDTAVILYRTHLLQDYDKDQSENIRRLILAFKELDVVAVSNVEFCPAESEGVLTWPATALAETVQPNKFSKEMDVLSITRRCLGDFINGAYWSNTSGWLSPKESYKLSRRLQEIRWLTKHKGSDKLQLHMLNAILAMEYDNEQLTVSEIKDISNILSKIEPENLEQDVPTIANITNNVILLSIADTNGMMFNSLKTAQKKLNSSNIILESLDKLLTGVKLGPDAEMSVQSQFATFVMDIDASQWNSSSAVHGIAIGKNLSFLSADIKRLSVNDSVDIVLNSGVESAMLLPSSLFNKKSRSHRVVMNIFSSAVLFGSTPSPAESPEHVFSVTVDGKRQALQDPLLLVFKKQDNTDYLHVSANLTDPCVFWDFQGNNGWGVWSSLGCSLAQENINTSYDICVCNHLTHFGKLLYNPLVHQGTGIHLEGPPSLTYITIVGCSLSILGICGIYLTAILLPEWHRGTGKKIQLHLSTALLLLMVGFLVLALVGEHNLHKIQCIITGALLHFSLLSVYLWMLVTAWYQYRRLAHPLQALSHARHYLLFSAVVAWGIPLAVCAVLLAINIDTYSPPSCYPEEQIQLFSVYIPICTILIANTLIYILILWSIFECKNCMLHMKSDCRLLNHQNNVQRIKLRLVSSVYLFVLLGLCWIFGFLGWEYLFCMTATLQGFSFFLFFVVFDKPTREKWSRLLKRWQGKDVKKPNQISSPKRGSWSQKETSKDHYVN